MLFREVHRDRLVAMATVVELDEGMDPLLIHLSKIWKLRTGREHRFKADEIYFAKSGDIPLLGAFGTEWLVTQKVTHDVLGVVDREPKYIAPSERFKPLSQKEINLQNHFEVVWEYYSAIAPMSVSVDSGVFVMKAIDPNTGVDTTYGSILRLIGIDFRAVVLATRLGIIVYIVTTEHILNDETKHGVIAASDAIDSITRLTGYVGDDGLESILSHIFGTGIINDDYRPLNWAQELEKALKHYQ